MLPVASFGIAKRRCGGQEQFGVKGSTSATEKISGIDNGLCPREAATRGRGYSGRGLNLVSGPASLRAINWPSRPVQSPTVCGLPLCMSYLSYLSYGAAADCRYINRYFICEFKYCR